jgi:hypothetical protein
VAKTVWTLPHAALAYELSTNRLRVGFILRQSPEIAGLRVAPSTMTLCAAIYDGKYIMISVTPNIVILSVVLAVAVIAVIAWFVTKQKQSQRLQQRFGPEYGRAVNELGSRGKAESELKERENRVARLNIIPLAPAEAERFTQAWNALQGRFVDNPKGAVSEADHLVRELMVKRGYPMGDFERRAADISVDHPRVVETYRAAQVIAARDERGEANTEELRKAIVHYRTLFDELLEVESANRVDSPTERVPVHT